LTAGRKGSEKKQKSLLTWFRGKRKSLPPLTVPALLTKQSVGEEGGLLFDIVGIGRDAQAAARG